MRSFKVSHGELVVNKARAPARRDRSPCLGSMERQLLHLLEQGPATTRCLAEAVALQRLGLPQREDLRVKPFLDRYKRIHQQVLSALRRLKAKGLIYGEGLVVGTLGSGPMSLKWWRLLTAAERSSGKVNHRLNQKAMRRIWQQAAPTLKRVEHWRNLS